MTLDSTGLTIKTAAEIEAEIDAALKAALPGIKLNADSAIGRIRSTFASKLGEVWALAQIVYDSMDPDTADGAQLDAAVAYNGLTRDPATPSTGVETFVGVDTTVIPIGTIVRITGGARFVTTAAGVITGGSVAVAIESEETGPIAADPGEIDLLVSVIPGVTSVTNAAAVLPGRDLESDLLLRRRRESSFGLPGAGTDSSIAARIAELDTVEQALVISNRTDATDALGIPSRAARPVIWPAQADNQPVFDVIWQRMPAGILIDGAITGTAIDSQGISQPVAYSLATELVLYVTAVLTIDATRYSGDQSVEDAIVDETANPAIGGEILLFEIECAIARAATGIKTLEVRAKVGSAPGPSDTVNITPNFDEIVTVDALNVLVVTS